VLAVRTRAIDGPVQHDLGGIVGDEYMAGLGLHWQAEAERALEFGGDLGVIGDGCPVSRDEHGFRGEQAHQSADLAGVKSLKQCRDQMKKYNKNPEAVPLLT
jgi:hypothetical protein